MSARTEVIADEMATGLASYRPIQLRGLHHDVGTDRLGERDLMRIASTDNDSDTGDVAAEPGNRRQPHRSSTKHSHDRIGRLSDRRPGEQGGVNPCGERLDQHGSFVWDFVGEVV